MKCIVVLSVLALAALGASGTQPASVNCPSSLTGSQLLLTPQYVWLESLYGPPDTLHPGIKDSFVASVHASQTSTVKVWFTLDKDGVRVYSTSRDVMVLGGDSVVLCNWLFTSDTGYFVAQDSLDDSLPADSSSVVTWRYWVMPWQSGSDISIVRVNLPYDTIDTLTPVTMYVELRNYGVVSDSRWLSITISDTAAFRVVYAESGYFRIYVGGEFTVQFPETRFTTLGPHHGKVRFWTYGGSAASLDWDFWVVAGAGVEEGLKPQAPSSKPAATVVRGLPPGAVVFDPMGRRVLNPKPGVYFVRSASGVMREASSVAKVVIQR